MKDKTLLTLVKIVNLSREINKLESEKTLDFETISKRKSTIHNLFWRISKNKGNLVIQHSCHPGFMFTVIFIGCPFVYISETNTFICGKFIKSMLEKWHKLKL